jgi:hypothetical protein
MRPIVRDIYAVSLSNCYKPLAEIALYTKMFGDNLGSVRRGALYEASLKISFSNYTGDSCTSIVQKDQIRELSRTLL